MIAPRLASKDEIVRAIRAERRATLALLNGLEAARFDLPTPLPGWRVREVVAHLITTDRASVTGTILPAILAGPDGLERWNDRQVTRWADRPVPELLLALDRWGRRFARYAATLPSAAYRMPFRTLWGRTPAALLLWSRAYDEWIHRQDVRRGLGLADDEVDIEPIAEFLLTVLRYEIPRAVPEARGRLAVSLEGVALPEAVIDLSSRDGPTERAAEAKVACPAGAFIMAAAGRDRFDDLEQSGALRLEGDTELARVVLSRLRVV